MINFFDRLDKFMEFKGLNDNKISVEAGISNGLIGKGRKRGAISQENISKILCTYPEIDANWLLTGKGEMLRNDQSGVQNNNKGVIVSGDNSKNSNIVGIDNRQYYSDSPDVLRAQIVEKDLLLREKDERLREKDEYTAELKVTIRELKETIKVLNKNEIDKVI
jgi:hypothetical protein